MVRPLLVDTTSVFAFQQSLKHKFPVQGNPNYAALIGTLEAEFPNESLEPRIGLLALDPQNENQKKFSDFMHDKLHFIVDATDFRDAFILPDHPYQRLSTRITYLAGLFASKRPSLIVVSDAFEIYYPLLDIVQARGGNVTVAFFRTGMEALGSACEKDYRCRSGHYCDAIAFRKDGARQPEILIHIQMAVASTHSRAIATGLTDPDLNSISECDRRCCKT
jgi:hypothetical protein